MSKRHHRAALQIPRDRTITCAGPENMKPRRLASQTSGGPCCLIVSPLQALLRPDSASQGGLFVLKPARDAAYHRSCAAACPSPSADILQYPLVCPA